MENTIYQAYNSDFGVVSESNNPVKVKINFLEGLILPEAKPIAHSKPFSQKIALAFAGVGVLILAVYFVPSLISLANFNLSNKEVITLSEETESAVKRNLPEFNPSLPKTNHILVSSIGVDTDIEEATYDNYEAALKKGVWRVSNFGQPDLLGAPVILAAHRYGYLAWTNTFRHKSSFYNLPKVKVGDVVTIYWQQRAYKYGVYKTENGTAITDYSADLILYTCENLNGEERIFVYAKLI